MSESHGGEDKILVVSGDQSFAGAVVDAVEATDATVSAECLDTRTGAVAQGKNDDVDGAVVDGQMREATTVVGRLAGEGGLPVVVLTDSTENGEPIANAIEAGATDVFPRTTASAQCELVVERITSEARDSPATTDRVVAEQPYREVFENVSDGLVVHESGPGEILDANERFCEIAGYDRDELVGERIGLVTARGDEGGEGLSDEPVADRSDTPRSFVEVAHPDDRELYERDAERLVEDIEAGDSDDSYEGRYRLQRDGETRWVNVARFPVENDDGSVDRIVRRVRDVTERRRVERRLRAILERIDDAIYVTWAEELTNPSLHPDDFYSGYEAIWGRPLEEIFDVEEDGFIGTLHPDERPGFRSFLAEIGQDLEAGAVSDRYSREYRIERADGERRWIRSDFYPTAWETGPLRMVIVSRDVTERRRREHEFEEIFNKVQGGITINHPETGEILEVNDSLCDLLGYSRDEILEMGVEGISASEEGFSMERASHVVQEVAETGEPRQIEWAVRTSDDETRWLSVRGTPATIGGEQRYLSLTRDITEVKRREREYEQIFNGVNDIITIHDPETAELLDVNDAFCDLLGHDREEIIENGVMEYTPSGQGYTAEEAKAFAREVVETGEPQRTEWAVETATGEIRWLDVKGTTVEIGGELRYVSIDRDVTERKRREEEYEQIFNGVQDAIVVHDPESGEMVDVNEAFCELVGYDRERVLELGTAGVSAESEGYTQDRAEEVIAEVMENGQMGPLEWKVVTSEGDHRVTEVVATRAEIGGELRHVSIQRDVTERKRREQEFEQIFNGVEDGLMIMDPETLDIREVNDAYLDMFGYDSLAGVREAGVSGMSLTEEGFTFEQGKEIHQRVQETGEPEVVEWRGETVNGAQLLLELKITPAHIGGEELNIVVHRDITERKRREQRLEVFNRILRHNLRNRLDVIRSHAELLADQTTDGRAERILAAVDELAGIGARARETDRIMSIDDTPVEIDLSESVRETVRAMESKRSDVTVKTKLPDDAPLRTNEEVLTVAVESALENAFDYAESTATVAIEDSPAGYVLTIEDDGPGIPAEELVPIEAGTETNLQHGRGLGLWQLRWSVDKLNGELSFDATTEGTTVRIAIPDRRGSNHPD